MKRDKRKHRIFSLLLALIIFITSAMVMEPAEASAASKYITVEAFFKYLVTEMKFTVNLNSKQPYIDAAMNYGILKKGDFKNYKTYLTRTDCAVIANRLDEYINFKYNYSIDIYNILSDCDYYDGRLYYNTKGKLYPVGATKDTYPASQFMDEVLGPVLEPAFKYDNWASQGLRAGYEYVYDDNNNITDRYIEIGVKPESEYNAVGIDPFNERSYIIQAWNAIHDGDCKLAAVLKDRISDISKVPKSKREAVAAVVAKGIIKGFSNGLYVQNRSFKGSDKITAAGAKEVIQNVIHPENRALVSPDGQLIRTTKLPKNAGDYPYILECFPNEYYEMRYNFMYLDGFKTGSADKSGYFYPKETNFTFLYEKFYKNHMSVGMDRYEYYDQAISQAEKYLKCIFNMNYKTVDDKWKKELTSTFDQYWDERVSRWLDNYISAAKKNHVVVESKIIAIDPGTIYYSVHNLYIRAYVKYRITADSVNVDQDELIYGHYNDLINLKNGEWRYGYYDLALNFSEDNETANRTYWGVTTLNRFSDFEFKGTY